MDGALASAAPVQTLAIQLLTRSSVVARTLHSDAPFATASHQAAPVSRGTLLVPLALVVVVASAITAQTGWVWAFLCAGPGVATFSGLHPQIAVEAWWRRRREASDLRSLDPVSGTHVILARISWVLPLLSNPTLYTLVVDT